MRDKYIMHANYKNKYLVIIYDLIETTLLIQKIKH